MVKILRGFPYLNLLTDIFLALQDYAPDAAASRPRFLGFSAPRPRFFWFLHKIRIISQFLTCDWFSWKKSTKKKVNTKFSDALQSHLTMGVLSPAEQGCQMATCVAKIAKNWPHRKSLGHEKKSWPQIWIWPRGNQKLATRLKEIIVIFYKLKKEPT